MAVQQLFRWIAMRLHYSPPKSPSSALRLDAPADIFKSVKRFCGKHLLRCYDTHWVRN